MNDHALNPRGLAGAASNPVMKNPVMSLSISCTEVAVTGCNTELATNSLSFSG
jgi:hypothetical protein